MRYEDIKRTKQQFETYVAGYIKAHPLESYGEIGAAVGIPEWKVQAIARTEGIRRLGGHPGVRLSEERFQTGKEREN